MRRILLVAVPAVVLIGLILLRRSIPDWRHPILTGSPGNVLYVATFDGAAAGDFNKDWEQASGRLAMTIADGVMRIKVDEELGGVYSVATPYFADFDLTAQARAAAGPEDNGFGIVFRLQDHENRIFTDDSYYLFLISSDGYYRVSRSTDGEEKILSDWIASDLIHLGIGAVNTLRVRAESNQFEFFINGSRVSLCVPDDPDAISTYSGDVCIGGSMLDTLQDSAIPAGRVGVGAIATDTGGSGVEVEFDNLVVLAPSKPAAST